MERRMQVCTLAFSLALVVILIAGAPVQAQMSLEERVQRLEEGAKLDESKNMEACGATLRVRTLDKNVEIRIGGRIQNDWNFIRPSDEIKDAYFVDDDGNWTNRWTAFSFAAAASTSAARCTSTSGSRLNMISPAAV